MKYIIIYSIRSVIVLLHYVWLCNNNKELSYVILIDVIQSFLFTERKRAFSFSWNVGNTEMFLISWWQNLCLNFKNF